MGLHARVYDKDEASIAWKWSGEISSQETFKHRVEGMQIFDACTLHQSMPSLSLCVI